ncbi:MAG: hypothetical protein RQ750_13320 [Roseovarius sp.]|nr:hypothetical protein [Roseovarius sp.]
MSDALMTVVLGDKAAKVAVADAPLIEAFKADAAKKMSDADAAHVVALEAKDAEIAKRDAEIADLKTKVLTEDQIEARAQERSEVVTKARKLMPDADFTGKALADVRKVAVAHALGDDAIKDKSDGYITGMFDALADRGAVKTGDTFRQVVSGGIRAQDETVVSWDQALVAAGMKKEA